MPNVTINSGMDIIPVANSREALSVLKSIRRNTEATADEITRGVSFSGLSLRDCVVTYSAFVKEESGINVISFEQRGKKKVPIQLALEYDKGGSKECA